MPTAEFRELQQPTTMDQSNATQQPQLTVANPGEMGDSQRCLQLTQNALKFTHFEHFHGQCATGHTLDRHVVYQSLCVSFIAAGPNVSCRLSYFIHLCFIVFYCVLLCFCHGILHIDVLIYSAPQLQECLINFLTYLFNGTVHCRVQKTHKRHNSKLHCVSKNDTGVAYHDFNAHQPILVIFGRDIADRVCYQKVICYPTSPN